MLAADLRSLGGDVYERHAVTEVVVVLQNDLISTDSSAESADG